MDIKGKKLLLIGCTNNSPDVKSFVEEHGVYLIAAGKPISQQIRDICQECFEIDILDKDAVCELIAREHVDGVFVGGNEKAISSVIDITEKMGLPFYSSRTLWDNLMNKQAFKEACRKYGVPTMKDYAIDEANLEKSASTLEYPVVIKPVDNCGCTGISKCESVEDFAELYNKAKKESSSGRVTVEEFNDGFEICVYYTFVDGKVTLSSMADKYVRGNVNSFIPLAEIYAYPSQYLPVYKETIDEKMRAMLLGLGIKNGITSMQGFVKDGKFTFFEMGYRLGGTAQYRYTQACNGINSFHMMMAHSLTGKMLFGDQDKDDASFNKPCCTLTLLSKGGTVARVEGIEEVEALPEVLYLENRYQAGDTIAVTGTTSQFHVRVYIIADSEKKMKEVINYIQSTVKAYDVKGESMLITNFDTNKLTFGKNFQ